MSPGNWWCWPPTSCGSRYEPWDWWAAIEYVETDPDNY
jgi:hypothetical protein